MSKFETIDREIDGKTFQYTLRIYRTNKNADITADVTFNGKTKTQIKTFSVKDKTAENALRIFADNAFTDLYNEAKADAEKSNKIFGND